MKRILKCSMIIIGTLIGAGFASGKEIATFFNVFMENGIIGVVMSSFLFGLVIYFVINMPKKNIEYTNNKAFNLIVKAFTFLCFCIMISAIGTYGNEQYNINFWVGTSFASAICFVLFLLRFKGLEKLNSFLVPIILIGVLLASLISHASSDYIFYEEEPSNDFLFSNWFLAAVLYTGYNSILLIPILKELRIYELKKKEIFLLSVFSSLILCLAGIMIYYSVSLYYPEILSAEMPMLIVAKNTNFYFYVFYNFVVLFAIFTTAFSSGYAFLMLNFEKNYFRNCALICAMSVLVSRIGFSKLVNSCFPIFGYIGITQMAYIFIKKRRINLEGERY